MKMINLPKTKKFSRKKYFSGALTFPLQLKSMPKQVYDKLIDYLHKALTQNMKKNEIVKDITIHHIEFQYCIEDTKSTAPVRS